MQNVLMPSGEDPERRDMPRVEVLKRLQLQTEFTEMVSRTWYQRVPTAVGHLWIAYRGKVLRLTSFVEDEQAFLAHAIAWLGAHPSPAPERHASIELREAVVRVIEEGERYLGTLDESVLTAASRAVLLQAVRLIPRGKQRSVDELLQYLKWGEDRRAEVRAVLSAHPYPGVIPCHRVFSDVPIPYAGGSAAVKALLLEREGLA